MERLTDAGTTAVDLSGRCFAPLVARVPVGETVTWTNRDAMDHAVSSAGGGFGGSNTLGAGGSWSVRFDRAGVFPYFCPLHPSMVGAIVVADGATAGVSGAGAVTLAAANTATAAQPAAAAQRSITADMRLPVAALAWLVAGVAAGAVATAGVGRVRHRR